MTRARKLSVPPTRLPISRVRQELCPLVESLVRAPGGKIAITVGEEVAAYLVSAERLAELEAGTTATRRRRAIVGSMTVVGDLDESLREISEEHERSFQRLVRQIDGSGE